MTIDIVYRKPYQDLQAEIKKLEENEKWKKY